MDKALMIMGDSPEQIAEALLKFAESYATTRQPDQRALKNDSEKMTTEQAAKFSDVSLRTFYKWINEGRIPFYGSDRKRFFYKSEVIEALKTLK